MSISSELLTLQNTKTAIRTAINNKGGSVGASDTFASYATAIDNLPSGGSGNEVIKSIDAASATPSYMGSSSIQYLTYFIEEIHWPATLSFPFNFANFYNNNQLPFLKKITVDVNNSDYDSRDNCNAVIKTSYNELLLGCRDTIIPNTVTSIGRNAFRYNRLLSVLPTIPSSVTEIGSSAFESCTALTSAVLPNSITQLPQSIFSDCSSLLSVTIGNQVTSIGNLAFKNCTALTSINIPNTVTSIGESAFQNCTSLTFVVVNATTPPTLGSIVFTNTNNCPIYVPAESVDAYKAASGWSTYASRIYPITQVATVDGNPVYNYDLRMTSTDTITSENMAKMPAGTSLEIAEGLTNISAGEINYQEVTLPSTFTGFGDSDMIGSSVTTITSNAVTPPSAFRNQLGGSGLTAIYVPASAVDTYKAHAAWTSFSSIIQAIPVQAKMTITLQDDSIYVEPSDGATTLNNEDLINLADAGKIETSVKKIEVGEMITELEDMYWDDDPNTLCGTFDMMSMSELVLPASLTAMGENTFVNGSVNSSGSITFYAVTPPTFTGELPGTPRRHPTIYVPAESVEAYQTAWSNYASWIQAIPTE